MPRIQYTPQEYANMHFVYGECRGNANGAAALYRERYPNARHPDYRVFIRVHRCFAEGRMPGTGVGGTNEGRNPRANVDNVVLNEIEADPSTSTRVIARRTGISKSSVHKILKKHEFHPFHVTRVQTLQPRDFPARVRFCQEMLQKINDDPEMFKKILWSDESSLKRDGYVNLHNLHSWQIQNPYLMREDRSQYQFKINYWAGIINGQIIGPFELPGHLNGESYLEFLRTSLPNLIQDVPEELRSSMWLQNDGCPAHFAVNVRRYLDQAYPNRWIGRLGPILWPPRSPDLNPLDFFLLGMSQRNGL